MSDMTSTKPYSIAKRTVWEAFQLVKANRGSAGVDDETIAMLEQNLSGNLYKLWNRMSSGSYFPPPVKQVEIPKAKGGTRKLGIPTVSDRIVQTMIKLMIEPTLEPLSQIGNGSLLNLVSARKKHRQALLDCFTPFSNRDGLAAGRTVPEP